MKHLLITLAVLFLFTACKKDKVAPGSVNEIGNMWTYHFLYQDSSQTNPVQVMTVEITGDTVMDNGDPARVWEFTLPDRTFYYMVKLTSTDFEMYRNLGETPYLTIPRSLTTSSTWLGSFCTDTASVTQQSEYTINDCYFEEVWHIERSAGFCTNWFLEQKILWNHDFGIVRFETEEYSLGPFENVVWEIVDVK